MFNEEDNFKTSDEKDESWFSVVVDGLEYYLNFQSGESTMCSLGSQYPFFYEGSVSFKIYKFVKMNDLISLITSMSEKGGVDGYEGICDNIEKIYDIYVDNSCFTGWEHHSGEECYPVKGPSDSAYSDAEDHFYFADDYWSGEYGELRKDLCRFLLNEIEEGLVVITDDYECLMRKSEIEDEI